MLSIVAALPIDAIAALMAEICAESSERPAYSDTSTEALGFWFSRTNTDGRGMARCTRADCTAESDWMVRASSPSIARW